MQNSSDRSDLEFESDLAVDLETLDIALGVQILIPGAWGDGWQGGGWQEGHELPELR